VLPNDEPCYVDYGGPWPGSERETHAVTSFILRRSESIVAFVTVHSYAQMILSRWAYTDQLYLPDHNETVRATLLSTTVAHKIVAVRERRFIGRRVQSCPSVGGQPMGWVGLVGSWVRCGHQNVTFPVLAAQLPTSGIDFLTGSGIN